MLFYRFWPSHPTNDPKIRHSQSNIISFFAPQTRLRSSKALSSFPKRGPSFTVSIRDKDVFTGSFSLCGFGVQSNLGSSVGVGGGVGADGGGFGC